MKMENQNDKVTGLVLSAEERDAIAVRMLELDRERKISEKQVELAVAALFAPTEVKYLERLIGKFNHYDGRVIFDNIANAAIHAVNERKARAVYLTGKGNDANEYAAELCEAVLGT